MLERIGAAKIEDEEGAPGGGRPHARSPKSERKRDAIVAAATAILNTRTYALATMSEIAAALDLRDATLYYYFPSKQALFFACHERSLQRFEAYLRAADAEAVTGAAKLELFLVKFVHDSARNGPLLYFGEYHRLEGQHRRDIEAWAGRLTVMLERFLQIGIEDGSIAPCETGLVVQLLIGMLIWLAKWVPGVEDLTASRLLGAMRAFSLSGLVSRPDADQPPRKA